MAENFTRFTDLCDGLKVHVASFLNTKEGIHLMMTNRHLHELISTNPLAWEGWKPIMVQTNWRGCNNPQAFHYYYLQYLHQLADAARDYDWSTVMTILEEHPEYVNVPRVGGIDGYTPLHHAAHGNAPLYVIRYMVYGLGAWRTMKTTNGMRAVDIALAQGGGCHHATIAMLELPKDVQRHLYPGILDGPIQAGVHSLLTSVVGHWIQSSNYRLPQLSVLAEIITYAEVGECSKLLCSIPGFFGDYSLELVVPQNESVAGDGDSNSSGGSLDSGTVDLFPKIVSVSYPLTHGRSRRRHEITVDGQCELVEEDIA